MAKIKHLIMYAIGLIIISYIAYFLATGLYANIMYFFGIPYNRYVHMCLSAVAIIISMIYRVEISVELLDKIYNKRVEK